jgi:quercetin dioxygenase-like cupin family protein
VIAGGPEQVAGPGDTVYIAPNENREIVNRGKDVCTILVAVAAAPAAK